MAKWYVNVFLVLCFIRHRFRRETEVECPAIFTGECFEDRKSVFQVIVRSAIRHDPVVVVVVAMNPL